MRARNWIWASTAVFSIAVLSLLGWQYVERRDARTCHACLREVHQHSRTVATVNGKRSTYCCPACAWSERQQTGGQVRILELTDHRTGEPLLPSAAWIVRDSDVNPCMEHHANVSPDKQPLHTHYDRCAPSLLAFATQPEAQAFARRHGGRILQFSTLDPPPSATR